MKWKIEKQKKCKDLLWYWLSILKKLLRKLMKSEKSVDVDQLDFDTALILFWHKNLSMLTKKNLSQGEIEELKAVEKLSESEAEYFLLQNLLSIKIHNNLLPVN